MKQLNKMARAKLGLVAIALMSGSLAACGSSSDGAASSTSAASATTAASGSSGGGSSTTTAGSGTASVNIPAGPIKIGILLPESGPFAGAATAVVAGYKAGAQLVNNAGGIDGHPIDLIVMNDQDDPAVAVTSANELVADHVVLMDEVGFNGTIGVTIPIFDKYHIPMLSEDDADVYRDAATYPYFFSPLTSDAAVMQLYGEAAEAFGAQKVAILSDSSTESENWVREFDLYAKEAGITITGDFSFPDTAVDVTTQVEQAKNSGVSTVILLADASLPAAYSAFQSLNWHPTIIDSYYATVDGWQALSSSPLAASTYYECSPPSLPSTTATFPPTVQSALQSIISASGGVQPGDTGEILNYETALIEKDAIEHAGVSGPAIKAYLETFRNVNVLPSGDLYTWTATDHLGNTGKLWLCDAGQVGDLGAPIYSPAIMAKIAAAKPLPEIPNFGPGAPAWIS